jgi:hypothetical protein
LYTKHGQHLNWRGKETMANEIVLSIEKVLKRKVDPINMEWQENNETDSQRHIEPIPVKCGIVNQEHIEPTHEKSDYTIKNNNRISNILEKRIPWKTRTQLIWTPFRIKCHLLMAMK